ncbi:MAG: hypothetical protein CSA82_03760 [Actinobacteria bacterium]|nr:MAG: hypothetical protein CSA82_03760 [Actinomycetota bacterium]
MAKTRNIDAQRLKAEAAQLRELAAVHAGRAAVRLTDLAEQGLEWAAPRAQQALEDAIDRATPLLNEAADRAQEAADRAKPMIGDVHDRLVGDYLPRINRAAHEAASAVSSEGDVLERARAARKASSAALITPTAEVKKTSVLRRCARVVGWTTLFAGIAGAGYVLWKRSQPIEDPWAEEYWADIETDVSLPDIEAEEEKVEKKVEDVVEEKTKDVKPSSK